MPLVASCTWLDCGYLLLSLRVRSMIASYLQLIHGGCIKLGEVHSVIRSQRYPVSPAQPAEQGCCHYSLRCYYV
jgi:hypothetical protein